MTNADKIGLIISSFIGLLIIAMAIVLLTGRGAFLIAGYNTLSKEEKEKYDSRALCCFMGKIMLPIGGFIPMLTINSAIIGIEWLPLVFAVVVIGLCIFAVIYANTSNRFKK